MTPVTIVKLGGSAITDKTLECTPDLSTIRSSLRQLSFFKNPLLLLHGAGSYGHPIVKRAQLQKGLRKKTQLRDIGETELCLDQLARIVHVALLREKIPFVPLRPMSFLTMKDDRVEGCFVEPMKRAIRGGLVPVIHGDLAFDSKKGVSVISADQLASRIGIEFNGSRVLFGCDVDGVFKDYRKSSEPTGIIDIVDKNNARQVLASLKKSAGKDVTGGMYGKVREALTLARRGHASFIFNLKKKDMLAEALAGNFEFGTLLPPWTD